MYFCNTVITEVHFKALLHTPQPLRFKIHGLATEVLYEQG